MNLTAIFPGSFDPITLGHIDVITRASRLFGRVIVAIGHNTRKQTLLSVSQRLELATLTTQHLKNVSVIAFEQLLVDFAQVQGAQVIIRCLRNTLDFEAEISQAQMNNSLASDINTLFITPSPQYVFISSTLVRELIKLGGDIKQFVPQEVYDFLRNYPDVATHY